MNKKLIALAILIFALMPMASLAQTAVQEPIDGAVNIPADAYYKARVLEIIKSEYLGTGPDNQLFQTLKIKILDGDEAGQEITIERVGGVAINGGKGFNVGDKIVVDKTTENGDTTYYVTDIYRIPSLIWMAVVFLVLILALSRWRGIASLLGLAASIFIIVKFIAPQILAGHNPMLISLSGALMIAVVSLYLAHGFNKRTSIALLSTVITLGLSVLGSLIFVHFVRLFGNGSEESIYLQFGVTGNINLQGLLLGGIILGALGVLDDITTAQSATVDELKKANPALGFKELYKSGISVGQEHISSLINTLFLAYAGVSLPLFLLLTGNGSQPLWTTLNSEFIAEEIVRTLVGSMTLIVAVPITTFFAAYFFSKTGPSKSSATHAHIH